MASHTGFWRKCRVGFRWVRVAVLLSILLLVCALGWFNRIGLPDILKRRLVQTLQTRGIDLEFSRMRLHFVHGLVIENVRIGHADTPEDPVLTLAEIQLELNYRALWHRQWQIDGLVLRQGKLTWPLSPTNALVLGDITADLRFAANDAWALDHFHADLAGAKLALSGDITHAARMRDWEIFRSRPSPGRAVWRAKLRQLADILDRTRFTGTPQLSLVVNGDARDFHSFVVRLNLNAPATRTAWGDARDLQLTANLTLPGDLPANPDGSLAWWTNALPCRLTWTARLAQLKSEYLNADRVVCNGDWRAPELTVAKLSAELGDGPLEATARLNVVTREFTFTNTSSFHIQAIAALLTEKTRERLADFVWTEPPSLQASGSLVLPAWTNREPDWRAIVQPTIEVHGELAVENAAIYGAPLDWVHTHFSYSNLVWQLPDVAVVRAKTRLALSGGENDRTQAYRWHIRGTFDPETLRPFLTTSNAARGLSYFNFTRPLALEADVAGRLYDYDSIVVDGRVALTNFTLRGQAADGVTSELHYANRVLECLHPRFWQGPQTMTADKITLDFNRRLIWFTNGFSTTDPLIVTRAIGPKTGRAMEPYQFLRPPTARVNGCLPLREMNSPQDTEGTDMSFEIVEGAPLHWLKLKTPAITGTIHWLGGSLILTNVQSAFYGGTAAGRAYFDFRVPHEGADYDFTLTVSNVDLHLLAADLSSTSNRLEGALSGRLVVTHGDSRDWQTWDGFGRGKLRDGLLWDIPVFGILSPVLNTFSTGLGNIRATDATAKFTMTNGVIYTDALEIRSTKMRLEYTGTVDLKQNVHARVTAQLLRDTWVVGPLVSTVLWPVSKLFEYKITGTLKNPKSEPVYVPKLLLLPLHPIRTLEEMFPGSDSDTNSPAQN
jgi:hypothetical protein